jgi:hypothetical protein
LVKPQMPKNTADTDGKSILETVSNNPRLPILILIMK